jgi:GGDEF domain-containing protein
VVRDERVGHGDRADYGSVGGRFRNGARRCAPAAGRPARAIVTGVAKIDLPLGRGQKTVAACAFEPRRGVRLSLSISAGAARFPDDGRTFDALLAAADERMYRDKAGRRSRTSGPDALAHDRGA